MKKIYSAPAVNVEEVKIEKGFAASQPVDTYTLENFTYEGKEGDANTAW